MAVATSPLNTASESNQTDPHEKHLPDLYDVAPNPNQQEMKSHIASYFSDSNDTSIQKKPMYNLSTAGNSYRYLKDINEIKDWEH